MSVYLLSICFCVIFILITVEFIRRKKIAERYGLLWLLLWLVLIVFSIFPALLDSVAHAMNIYYAPSLLFLIGVIFLLACVMHLTIVISKQELRLTKLIQEMSILKSQLEKEENHDNSTHRPS